MQDLTRKFAVFFVDLKKTHDGAGCRMDSAPKVRYAARGDGLPIQRLMAYSQKICNSSWLRRKVRTTRNLSSVMKNHVVTRLQLFEPWRRSWHEVIAVPCVPN